MARSRKSTVLAIARGVLVAAAATLVFMLLLSLAIIYLNVNDAAITVLNQIVKIFSITAGVFAGVGPGGEKGFHLGFVIAVVYMLLGYFMYLQLGGAEFDSVAMMGEILLGGAVGCATGTVFANLRQPRRAKR